MLRWLRRLFSHKDPRGYSAAEREIFKYWDGKQIRRGDPLKIDRSFLTNPDFDPKLDPQICRVPTPDGIKAIGRVTAAVRKAFGVAELEDGGLTDGECLALFGEFYAYIAELEESARPLASSPGPTVSAAGGATTPSGAASGSTAPA